MDASPVKSVHFPPVKRQAPGQYNLMGANNEHPEPYSTIKNDPDNPFLVDSTPGRANARLDSVHRTPGGSIIERSKVGEIFDEMLEVQIRLKGAIETAERKAFADKRALSYKIETIRKLEAEVQDLRKQNEALKRENDELRQRCF